ncbi:MAG TPA: HD domain-containing phosphohydrolase [Ktedonobacterales bacterium]
MFSAPPSDPLRLAELVAALSLATDIGTGQPMEHGLRACLLATTFGASCGLDQHELSDVYYVALLRGIGCVAYAHRVAEQFGDEIAANAHISLADTANPSEMLRLMLGHIGEGRPAVRRARMFLAALATGPGERNDILAGDCEIAARLAQRLGMRPEVEHGVAQVYERWDGKGSPAQARGENISRAARIVTLARDAELFLRHEGIDSAVSVLRRRAGTMYDPQLTERFCAQAASLATMLNLPSAWDAVLTCEPGPQRTLAPAARETAMRAIADFVDMKSSYTSGHSSGVALLAATAAERMGMSEEDVSAIRQAGYLHDIGRVGVTTAIWDKPGSLTESERERVRLHPYYTDRVLARPQALAKLAQIAALHHERLDGSGYYRGIPATLLPLSARLLAAADVYHAMTERRPHRAALTAEVAAEQLQAEARAGRLDAEAVQAVLSAAGSQSPQTKRVWPAGLSEREVEVLRLMAQGLSNRQMAAKLIIAEKTVGHHIQHIYNKINVSTRAGATLFALQHDLLDSLQGAQQ